MNGYRSARDKGRGLRPPGSLLVGKRPSGANEAEGLGTVSVARDAIRSADHRGDERHQLSFEQASLTVGRKPSRVELINLSGGGAMIRTDVALAMWQKVHLGLGDCTPVECAVRWIRGDRIGLEFAPETQVGGDSDKRAAMLLEALKRSFPESAPAPGTPAASPTREQRRTEFRHPLIWWGEIRWGHLTTRVRLRNISAGGALLESNFAFPGDAEVLLDLGAAGQHGAAVTWSRGDQVGLRFAAPFEIDLLARLKPEVAIHHGVGPVDPRSSCGTDADPAHVWQSPTLANLREELEAILKR